MNVKLTSYKPAQAETVTVELTLEGREVEALRALIPSDEIPTAGDFAAAVYALLQKAIHDTRVAA